MKKAVTKTENEFKREKIRMDYLFCIKLISPKAFFSLWHLFCMLQAKCEMKFYRREKRVREV